MGRLAFSTGLAMELWCRVGGSVADFEIEHHQVYGDTKNGDRVKVAIKARSLLDWSAPEEP
jgi:hypothetical protein